MQSIISFAVSSNPRYSNAETYLLNRVLIFIVGNKRVGTLESITVSCSNLKGRIEAPPSKSICHRAIISSGLSGGISTIENVMMSDDIIATLNGMETFGSKIKLEENKLTIRGCTKVRAAKGRIDCKSSASTLRFLIPIALLTGDRIIFDGTRSLEARPLSPYYSIFDSLNIHCSPRGNFPMTLQGRLVPGEYKIQGNISSQFITGLMFALPLLDNDSKIVITGDLESKSYVDLTIDTLKKFGIAIENRDYSKFYIYGGQIYRPCDFTVESDYSQSAFWLALGVLGGEVECLNLNRNSLQGDRVIVDIIKRMGGNISVQGNKVRAVKSNLKGITLDASDCPDIIPAVSALAAFADGETRILNAGRLRLKESDRLKTITCELNKLGACVRENDDGLIIEGRSKLNGGLVDSHDDHRIAMMLAVASAGCVSPVTIINSSCVKKSYPGFFEDLKKLGGIVYGRSLGKLD